MKNNLLNITVIILLLFNGCAATYSPMSVDIPLIKNKGDIRIDAGGFIAHDFKENELPAGIQATFSAGLTNVVAVQTHASVDLMTKIHLQGAVGLYKKIDNETVIELYNGYGFGSVYGNDSNYQLAFSQFNIGKTGVGAKKNIDYGLGLKGGYLFAGNFEYKNYQEEYKGFFKEYYQENVFMFEPSIFLRFGGRMAKFSTRVNYLLINKNIDAYHYFPFSMSVGVNYSLGKRK